MESASVEPLAGEAFTLRVLVEEDADLIVAASRTDVPDWTYIPRDLDGEGARAWIRRSVEARERGQAIRFVIEADGLPAGTVGAQHPYAHDSGVVETFYFVLPEFRRRGLATSALRSLNDWVQRAVPELRRLQLHAIIGNPGSERVAELAGYVREGISAHQIPAVNGYGPRDAVVYGLAVSQESPHAVGGVLA